MFGDVVVDKIPAYIKVYNTIKREILDGEYTIGELLPAEPLLEKRFSVSRTTIRRAIEMLSREGLVKVQQGRGTEVLDNKTKQGLNVVTSISETLRNYGYIVTSRNMYIDIIPASAKISSVLKIPEGDEVVRIQRIQLANGVPIVIMRNYLPKYLVPNIQNYVNTFSSLYKFLEEYYNINIDSATDRISAKTADFTEAEMLDVPIGTAILCMFRVCYSNGKPVSCDRLSIVGDKYELEVNMAGRTKY